MTGDEFIVLAHRALAQHAPGEFCRQCPVKATARLIVEQRSFKPVPSDVPKPTPRPEPRPTPTPPAPVAS
jgi:hypothetical protein